MAQLQNFCSVFNTFVDFRFVCFGLLLGCPAAGLQPAVLWLLTAPLWSARWAALRAQSTARARSEPLGTGGGHAACRRAADVCLRVGSYFVGSY